MIATNWTVANLWNLLTISQIIFYILDHKVEQSDIRMGAFYQRSFGGAGRSVEEQLTANQACRNAGEPGEREY
jgi:hypothetical protein